MENGHSHTDVFGAAELVATVIGALGGGMGPRILDWMKHKTRFGGAVEQVVHAVQNTDRGYADEATWGTALQQLAAREDGRNKVRALTELLDEMGKNDAFEATAFRLIAVGMKKQTLTAKKAPPAKDGAPVPDVTTTSTDIAPVVDFMDFCATTVLELESPAAAREFLKKHQFVKEHWTKKGVTLWRNATALVARHTGLDGKPDERGIADELGDMLSALAASLPDPEAQVPVKMGILGRFVNATIAGPKPQPEKIRQGDGAIKAIGRLLGF